MRRTGTWWRKLSGDVASDMVISPKVNGSEYGYAEGALSGGNMSDLISGISSAVSEALAGFSGPQGNIVIPVYVAVRFWMNW